MFNALRWRHQKVSAKFNLLTWKGDASFENFLVKPHLLFRRTRKFKIKHRQCNKWNDGLGDDKTPLEEEVSCTGTKCSGDLEDDKLHKKVRELSYENLRRYKFFCWNRLRTETASPVLGASGQSARPIAIMVRRFECEFQTEFNNFSPTTISSESSSFTKN